ncbi:hypothetical protein CIHG_03998 [Coccidioides immitis H538.4]|uniref:Uncharacterized protein n=1 Tax=Coccidioides immitis H538.4 TaxID=396776 RepID=A0A0J8RM83_COCIT|nr:hypothetical protein CIHG_03998 [Coccidioides immitis H538.4]
MSLYRRKSRGQYDQGGRASRASAQSQYYMQIPRSANASQLTGYPPDIQQSLDTVQAFAAARMAKKCHKCGSGHAETSSLIKLTGIMSIGVAAKEGCLECGPYWLGMTKLSFDSLAAGFEMRVSSELLCALRVGDDEIRTLASHATIRVEWDGDYLIHHASEH